VEFFFQKYLLTLDHPSIFISLSRSFEELIRQNQQTKFYFLRDVETKKLETDDCALENFLRENFQKYEAKYDCRKVIRQSLSHLKALRVEHLLRLMSN